jgi:outer membrane protein
VNRQVRDAFRGMLSTISRVEALKAATISATSALESTQAGYEVGTRTIVDVLNVQRNLFSSQRDYFRSRYDYIVNGLSLKSAAGNLSEEDLVLVNTWLER